MTDVDITVLGSFAVTVGGVAVDEAAWPSRRSLELVQLLAITPGHQLVRDQAIDLLWPHLDLEAGSANLRKAAFHARQALGCADAVVLRRGAVALFPGHDVTVDADVFERLARAGDAAALDHCPGDLLPSALYEDWTEPRRTELRDLRLACLLAARRWEDVATLDPTDEASHRELMAAALASGRRAVALRWYGHLRSALAELGVSPSPETEALHAACVAEVGAPAPQLVGRSDEMAALEALLAGDDLAPTGVLLRGPAGIGKTALCRAFAERARAGGATVIPVAGTDPRAPYGVLATTVESLLAHSAADGLPSLTRSVLEAVAARPDAAAGAEGPIGRHRIIGALRRLLLAVGGGGPVVVLADDLHQADEASVEALLHLASPRDPTTLVLAMRGEPSRPELDRHLGRMVRAHRLAVVEVGPLADHDMAELIRATDHGSMSDDSLRQITALAAGNPFAGLELASGSSTGDRIPIDVGRAITSRFVDLPADVVQALRELAVIADDVVDVTEVIALSADDEGRAFEVLDQALDAGVLVVEGDSYRFRHDLVRRALAEQVPPHRRQAIHCDAAHRLAARGGPPAKVARHWLASGRPAEAVDPLLAVADQASGLGAFAAALEALADVLAVAPDHADALRRRAEALDALGDVAAVPAYDAAIAAADEAARDDLRAKRALAQLKQGDAPGAVRSLDGVQPTALDARLAEALTYSGAAALGFVPPDVGTAKSAECRRLALEAGDASAIVVASWAGAAAAHARGELRESVLADLQDTSHLPHLATRVFDGQLCVTQRFLYGARPYDEVIQFADALAAEAKRLGSARGHAFGTILRGEAALLAGRLDDAERDLVEARLLHRDIGGVTGEAHSLQRLAEVALCRGDGIRAEALLDEALDLARATDMGFHLLDRIYGTRLTVAAATGDAGTALDEAEASVQGTLETCPGCRITFAVPAAIAAVDAGDLTRAAEYEQSVAFLAAVVMRLPAWDAAHHEVLARMHRAAGEDAAAAREAEEAVAAFTRAGQPLDALRCSTLL